VSGRAHPKNPQARLDRWMAVITLKRYLDVFILFKSCGFLAVGKIVHFFVNIFYVHLVRDKM